MKVLDFKKLSEVIDVDFKKQVADFGMKALFTGLKVTEKAMLALIEFKGLDPNATPGSELTKSLNVLFGNPPEVPEKYRGRRAFKNQFYTSPGVGHIKRADGKPTAVPRHGVAFTVSVPGPAEIAVEEKTIVKAMEDMAEKHVETTNLYPNFHELRDARKAKLIAAAEADAGYPADYVPEKLEYIPLPVKLTPIIDLKPTEDKAKAISDWFKNNKQLPAVELDELRQLLGVEVITAEPPVAAPLPTPYDDYSEANYKPAFSSAVSSDTADNNAALKNALQTLLKYADELKNFKK